MCSESLERAALPMLEDGSLSCVHPHTGGFYISRKLGGFLGNWNPLLI